MRFLFVQDGVGTLRLALAEGEILAGSFVERDHQIVRRHAGRRSDAGVDVFQEWEPRLFRPALCSLCRFRQSSTSLDKIGRRGGAPLNWNTQS